MFYVVNVANVLLLFVDAFDELTDKKLCVSNLCLSYSVIYLRCKFLSNILNYRKDFANLLLRYFNLGHPVYTYLLRSFFGSILNVAVLPVSDNSYGTFLDFLLTALQISYVVSCVSFIIIIIFYLPCFMGILPKPDFIYPLTN